MDAKRKFLKEDYVKSFLRNTSCASWFDAHCMMGYEMKKPFIISIDSEQFSICSFACLSVRALVLQVANRYFDVWGGRYLLRLSLQRLLSKNSRKKSLSNIISVFLSHNVVLMKTKLFYSKKTFTILG